MKTIGLIGGMSWESSQEYYRILNEEVKNRVGGLHSAKCILYNVDFEEIERYQSAGDWESVGKVLRDAAQSLERAGVDFIILCTNTAHKVVGQIEKAISLPILHIADATTTQIKKSNISTVGLLGTTYTMEEDFYKSRLESNGIQVLIPNKAERDAIHTIIFKELCLGITKESSRDTIKKVIHRLLGNGAEGIVLGCTELGLAVKPNDLEIALFDTTFIHAREAVHWALER
ncbi:aspartate/glutamate racemase family protein [Sporosarcina sp. FSL W7-1349]|uniref:aspartate/glutamate racemase family protein n=1 Tax=Sporosarcina sp. FSL W7-1349 TaxID=2921561 RepID=UPI0030FC7EF4